MKTSAFFKKPSENGRMHIYMADSGAYQCKWGLYIARQPKRGERIGC